MGQENIKAACGADFSPQGSDTGGHFLFRIHMHTVRAVAERTAEPENADSFDQDDFPFRGQAAFRRILLIAVIVVAVNIDDRRVGKTGQERQVFRGQVPGGQDQVYTAEGFPAVITPEPGRRFIRNGQNPYVTSSLSVPAEG